MKKRMTGLLLTVIIIININSSITYAKEIPDELKNLYAQSAVLMDADSGRILFGKNEADILAMASTTKIMTCILALENMNQRGIAIVSENAARQPKVHLGVREGERYYLKDLLYSLMLESHNDSAVLIAEAISGTVENFAKLMNQKALEIGCENTYFITPNGLDAKDEHGKHSTTAKDLALIMRYCMHESPERENFLQITGEKAYQFCDVDRKRSFTCYNHNSLLSMMEGALSGKTGFTNDAGYCYVGAVKNGDKTFIVALLACGWPNNKEYKWKDTKKLMEYGIHNYEYRKIPEEDSSIRINIINGVNEKNPLKKERILDTRVVLDVSEGKMLLHKDEEIEVKYVIRNQIQAPVKRGENLGFIYYLLSGEVVGRKEVVAENNVNIRNIYSIYYYLLQLYYL